MAFKIKFSHQAASDLDEIIYYISSDLHSPKAAERFYKEVNKRLDLISDNPHMYPLYHDKKIHACGFRFIVIGNYLMLYQVDDESSSINITRLLYGGRDLSAVFEEMQ